MTLLHSPPEIAEAPEQPRAPQLDLEALFEEAHRRRRNRWILGSGVTALLIAALCIGVSVTGGNGDGSRLTSMAPGKGSGSSLLSHSTGSFQAVAAGILANPLDCASETTCYAVVYPQPGDALHDWLKFRGAQLAKTVDGGKTWILIRSFPRRWSPHPVMSCPVIEMCVVAVQPDALHNNSLPAHAIAITKDGGSTWTIDHLSVPALLGNASIERIMCRDDLHCLAFIGGQGSPPPPGAFLSTSDGGATWTQVGSVALDATKNIVTLRCDFDGRCIALAMDRAGGLTLTSSDFGRTWTKGTQSPFASSAVMNASCGDAFHCMYSTGGGGLAFTQNGGESWALSALPVPNRQIITAVDCDNGLDCFAAAAQWNRENYTNPVIYETNDGGQAWRTFKLPTRADGWYISTVVPLSCPNSRGCIGIAQMRPSSPQPETKRVMISSFRSNPVATP